LWCTFRRGCRHGLVPTSRHGVAWYHSASYGGTAGAVVFRQLSCATWYRRGLRHCLLISRRHRTRVGSHPRSLVVLLACGVSGHDPELRGRGPCWLRWPLSQGHYRGSHPIVGGVVYMSRRAVFGRWVTILVVTAWQCCLISAAWRGDGVRPDRSDCYLLVLTGSVWHAC
jgi:hypothetical protein